MVLDTNLETSSGPTASTKEIRLNWHVINWVRNVIRSILALILNLSPMELDSVLSQFQATNSPRMPAEVKSLNNIRAQS